MRCKFLIASAFIAYAGLCLSAPAFADQLKDAQKRAAGLVAHMTLEEKALQLGNNAPAIPRLGIPKYNWWNEGLHGVARAGTATVFRKRSAWRRQWNTPLMHKVADTISTEFRAKYVERVQPDGGTDWYRGLTVWSPNINIFRDPRWGRGQETYGEDPYLTSRMGVAFIRGLQGDDPWYYRVIATSKHFAVHSGPESTRHQADIHPSAHDLEDTYLPAFRTTVMEGGVQSVMCAYNSIDGVPACANDDLLKAHLRKDWGFSGYVVSDCGAAANVFRPDALHYTKSPEEGVAKSFDAGMDVICGDYRNNMSTEPEHIVAAVQQGLLKEKVIDQALQRLFVARIRLGLLDPPAERPFKNITAADNDTPAHRDTALEMRRRPMVLLKNEGNLLPLAKPPATIAVIGPNADSLDALIGNYYGTPSAPVTVLDGIRARFLSSKVIYAQGTGLVGPAEAPVPDKALCVDAKCRKHGSPPSISTAPIFPARQPKRSRRTRMSRGASKTVSPPFAGRGRSSRGLRRIPVPVASQNGYRIWVGDTKVVDEWGVSDAPSIDAGAITLKAIRNIRSASKRFSAACATSKGLVWSLPNDTGDDAVAAANKADVVVFVGGLSARVEGEEMRMPRPGSPAATARASICPPRKRSSWSAWLRRASRSSWC